MTQTVYQWVRNLAVYYILLTAVMQVIPVQYGKYIRYFMGLLLILILSSPVLNLWNLKERVTELFREKILEEEYLGSQWAQAHGEGGDSEYYVEAYEQEMEQQLQETLEGIVEDSCGIRQIRVQMGVAEETQELSIESVQVWLEGAENPQMRESVENELSRIYGIPGEKVALFFEELE